MKLVALTIICILLGFVNKSSQRDITIEDLKPFAIHFSLTEAYKIEGKAQDFFLEAIGQNQFVGLAELHHSKQLSYFTIGFLELLEKKKFDNFALEVGPYSAEMLQKISKDPNNISESIKTLNKTYGKKLTHKPPIPFVEKIEGALFLKKASQLNYSYWGLDQEYSFSFEMHLDTLFSWVDKGDNDLQEQYKKSKKIIQKSIFKKNVDGQPNLCWILNEPTINQFFEMCQSNTEAKTYIDALKLSWDIYCKSRSNIYSSQIRADYMKSNFDRYYDEQKQGDNKTLPKVFAKLGSVHLSHGISPFGVNDMGEYLSMKAKKNNTGFLSIRHLRKYRNGRNLSGKSGWEGHELLMSLGKKDSWTIIDLRSIKKRLENKELKAGEILSFQINNYDLILIPHNDKRSKFNN